SARTVKPSRSANSTVTSFFCGRVERPRAMSSTTSAGAKREKARWSDSSSCAPAVRRASRTVTRRRARCTASASPTTAATTAAQSITRSSGRGDDDAQPADRVGERHDADRLQRLRVAELAPHLADPALDDVGLVADGLAGERKELRLPRVEPRRAERGEDLVD